MLALYDGLIFVRDFKAWKSKFEYFGQLWQSNVNNLLIRILRCNWKSKFWSVAFVYKQAHVAIKKKTFGPQFLLVHKSVGGTLIYHFSLCDAGKIIIIINDIKKYGKVFTISLQ